MGGSHQETSPEICEIPTIAHVFSGLAKKSTHPPTNMATERGSLQEEIYLPGTSPQVSCSLADNCKTRQPIERPEMLSLRPSACRDPHVYAEQHANVFPFNITPQSTLLQNRGVKTRRMAGNREHHELDPSFFKCRWPCSLLVGCIGGLDLDLNPWFL